MILRLKNKINMIALICILGITIIFSILNISVVTTLSKSKIDASLSSNMNYLIDLLDAKYPGSFSVQDGNLFKGDTNLSNRKILSHLKSKTGLEYTLFCMDTRINTTIGNGTIIGTKCEEEVFTAAKKGATYKHNLIISGTDYATYYSPIKNEAGEVIGMYFLGENLKPYTQSVYNNLIVCFIVTILALVIAIVCTNIFSQTISTPITELLNTLNRIKEKDFTSTCNQTLTSREDEIGDLSRGLMSMQQTISNILLHINQISSYIKTDSSSLSAHANEMYGNSERIVAVTQEIAANTTKQANEILSIDSTINVLANNIEFIASLILGINSSSHDISALSTEANKNMQTTTESMSSFNDSFTCFTGKIEDLSSNINKVNKITTVIHSISKQTNLLALNAAIEASRAGDSGKSFAVVAEQIRALAVQSQQSAESISVIVSNLLTASNQLSVDTTKMSTMVDKQIHNVTTNITNFSKIIEDLDKMLPDITKAYTYTTEITKQKEHIVKHIDNISVTAQNISAACEEVASSAEETNNVVGEITNSSTQLNKISNTLNSNFESFKLN